MKKQKNWPRKKLFSLSQFLNLLSNNSIKKAKSQSINYHADSPKYLICHYLHTSDHQYRCDSTYLVS